jgi:polysaccharide biosynthesis protein PelA
MKKIWLLLLTLTALMNIADANSLCPENPLYCNWVVYYSDQAQTSDFDCFNPIVLDADVHPSLPPLLAEGKTLLGYVSLGEIGNYRYYFQEVQNAGILISQDPNYPGSWYVDIRSPFWTNLMISTVIPNILNQGFQGIFMDSLDVPIYLEAINPSAYSGMTQAAINLVIAINNAFPNAPLMLNRAYQILADLGGYITYALGESVYTTYDFSTQQYEYLDQSGYQWSLGYLQGAQELYPNLNVMSLDYWDPSDPVTITKIYKVERNNGFIPYVTTIALNVITPEPT